MGMPSCGQRLLAVTAMAADDALIQAMRERCGRLCINKCFI